MAACVVLSALVLWQVAVGFNGLAAPPTAAATATQAAVAIETAFPTASDSPAATSSGSPAATQSATPTASPSTTPMPTATARPTARPTPRPTPSPTARPSPSQTPTSTQTWQQDPQFLQAKAEGRVTVDSSGRAVVLAKAPSTPVYPEAIALDTKWSGRIQEPPKTGKDDNGRAYTDTNYAQFCGPGSASVVLYYWPDSFQAVTTKAGTFTEPVDLGKGRYASTYWRAQDPTGYARGMIMYLADAEWPTPDRGMPWWPRPGVMRWSSRPSTHVENLIDAINWEASGQSRLDYFYVIVKASQLTAPALLDHVHSDIDMGVPVVLAVRTSDGKVSLPDWRVRSRKSAVNHFVTIVGYDDASGTYSVMDTCGLSCNDREVAGGVRNISQTSVFSLVKAESDDDGIMW